MEGPQVIAGRSEIGEETEIMDEHPPPLPSDPRDPKYRAALEAHIRAGSIDESAGRAALDEIKKLPPQKSALEQRIEELELLLNSSIIGNHAINVAAVLEGYKSGDLLWLDDQYYVFAEGKRVAGPRPMSGFDPQQVLWGEFPNPRSVWLEVCRGPRYLIPAFRQTIYCDQSGHHHTTGTFDAPTLSL